MNRNSIFIGGAFLVGAATGYAAAFKLVERRLMAEFDEAVSIAVEQERAAARAGALARQPYATPQEAVEQIVIPAEAQELIEVYQGDKRDPVAYHKIKPSTVQIEKEEAPPPPEPVQEENIFEQPVEASHVYVIDQLEFQHGKPDYDKQSINYYAEEGILCDQDDDPFENAVDVVGDGLLNFGVQSGDDNVVFVRNDKIEIDFEITRDPGSYYRTMGLEPAPPRPSQNGG